MPNRENLETSHSADENLRRRRETIVKAKSKSLNPSEKSNEEEPNEDNDNEIERSDSNERKDRNKYQKMKMKIKRQASLEEVFPVAAGGGKEETVKSERDPLDGFDGATKSQEKRLNFLEELKVPKIEILRKNGVGDNLKVKDFAILSPNSSKLRERFSKSKFLKQDSKNLNVELSKSSDSGIGVSRSTEDDSLKTSESVIFRFFDIGPETRLNKSDSERSPNFLDTVSLFTRSRSHERSVSSDSSDKNLSDMDKPSIKIRKRHKYSESRDSSSSYEGSIFEAHISNRVRKLHEVALKQMSEESAKSQKSDSQKRSVEFKYPVEFGSYDSIPGKSTPSLSKVRKFKSLERTDSSGRPGESFDDDDQNSGAEGQGKMKNRSKKQDRFVKRLSLKDKRGGSSRESGSSADRKKEKRCRGFMSKSRKGAGGDESDENVEKSEGKSDSQEKDGKGKEDASKRLSRKDKKSTKKTKRALSEEHRGSRKERSLLFSLTGGKRRSDSESRQGQRELSNGDENDDDDDDENNEEEEEDDEEVDEESELSEGKSENVHGENYCVEKESGDYLEMQKNLNPTWGRVPKKIYSMQRHRNEYFGNGERNKSSVDFVEIGSYLEVVGKIWPMSDDYKIVFISSDSSTKENRSVSTATPTTTDSDSGSAESGTDSSKKLASDCDWDYFDSSSMVRPVIKDWNWHGSPRNFSETFLERGSPVFSTSDDNSPKFPRRNLGKVSVRDSPVSYDTDVSGFSPSLQRKAIDLDSGKFQPAEFAKSNPYGNEDSQPDEKAIEVSELKASPPIKNKEFVVVKESNGSQKKADIVLDSNATDVKHSEESKKSKKRRKSKKPKKGNSKDDEPGENVDDSKESLVEKGEKEKWCESQIKREVNEAVDDGSAATTFVNIPLEAEKEKGEQIITRGILSPDDAITVNENFIEESVEKKKENPSIVQSAVETNANKDSKTSKNKGNKAKKQKNKKKCDKCGKPESKSSEQEASSEPGKSSNEDDETGTGGLVSSDYGFQAGSFGFQAQNLIPSHAQYPSGVLAYNCPLSNVIQETNVFQNFVPIPVPVLIPVPFPVPTAVWSQNLCFPNLNLNSENFNILNNIQNLYSTNYQNLVSQPRNDNKEASHKPDENNSTGSGSIHIRPINIQRPALTVGPSVGDRSYGSVDSVDLKPTCITADERESTDNETIAISEVAVEKNHGGSDEEKRKSLKEEIVKNVTNKKSKRSKSLTDKLDPAVTNEPKDMDMKEENEFCASDSTNSILKTFKDTKNDVKDRSNVTEPKVSENAKSEISRRDLPSTDVVDEVIESNDYKNVILIDEKITCETIESSLLNIDKKSECSSTSRSEDSEENEERKPFRKSYYFNGRDSEGKTSDDSDIADLSSSEEETKTEENSSQAHSTASEDEGNPDSRFSEVYVVNDCESDHQSKNESKEINGKYWDDEEGDKNEKEGSFARKENRKLKNLLPMKVFPLSDDTDSDNGRESSVVLLKHVKKLPEEDATTETSFETPDFHSRAQTKREKNACEPERTIPVNVGSSEVLPRPDAEGAVTKSSNEKQDEDPVILVTHLADVEPGRASIAESKIVPGSVHEAQLNSNSSDSVFSEINSVSFDSAVEKIGSSSTAFLNGYGGPSKNSENSISDVGEDKRKVLRHGDVDNNGKSEVINGDLLIESSPGLRKRVKNGRGHLNENISSLEISHDSDELKTNKNGFSLLDKIESRIRHYSTSTDDRSQGNENKYTSLIMITQDKNVRNSTNLENNLEKKDSVNVITTNTTKVFDVESSKKNSLDDVCLRHANCKSVGEEKEEDNEEDSLREKRTDEDEGDDLNVIHRLKSLEDYYTMTLENSRGLTLSPKKPNVIKNMTPLKEEDEVEGQPKEEVHVVTDDKTLSAVICLEEGLADDDSWVEDLEKDRDNDFANAVTEEDSSSGDETQVGACVPVHSDREEELRGYHRGAINFTLHTIVEESCEESEVEDKNKTAKTKQQRPTSVTDLEKYFYFDIGGGMTPNFEAQDLDTFSESSSSIYSDSGVIDDTSGEVRENSDQNQLSTSRLEKYFLNFDRDGREKESDGSVGSDSEGPPSPEQRRKRLFRARASNRLHSNSLDNLVQSENEQPSADMTLDSEDSSTETDMPEPQNVDKSDDSVKRKRKRKISGGSSNVPLVIQEGTDKKAVPDGDGTKENRESLTRDHRHRDAKEEIKDAGEDEDGKPGNLDQESDDERCKTPQMDSVLETGMSRDKQQSRDSGFIGSCDDLLKDQKTGDSSGSETKKKSFTEKTENASKEAKESENASVKPERQSSSGLNGPTPPATALTRKDSFNNWSSDEETNLMMTKMRQFFKAMVSVPKTPNKLPENSNPSSPQVKAKGVKSPQLVYFENELTRLMKTVPGIRDDQVRELVEYLSSEDTWSDSYDSSDYTSSDLEGTAAYYQRSQLQQEISESCKQIIDKFDPSKEDQESKPKVPPRRNSSPMNRETAMVYQKLVASFNKITNENENPSSMPHTGSPPLFAKVMHHIGSRLVALMHEVSSNSSGEGSISSHKSRYHKRVSQKLSNVSSTTEEECGLTDESDYKGEDRLLGQNLPYFQLLHQLPRSKSHDLLLEEGKVKSLRSSSSGVSDIAEEKEASDYERFSWRGSFESALMADSRSKLTLLSNDSHSSNTNLAAKRRSAGDLLFLKSLSREQLDRVRSCGSIGGVAMEDKNIWTTGRERNGRRRSSVPDAASPGSGASADGDEDSSDSEMIRERSITLPRGLQSMNSSQNTNSLPRLPTNGATNTQNLSKAQSVQHFLPNAKSARYRPPGFSRMAASSPKRAVSAPGLPVLQPSHARRERRRNHNFLTGNASLSGDESNSLELSGTGAMTAGMTAGTPTIPHVHGGSKSASPSPIVGGARSRLRRGPSSTGSPDWTTNDEIQRLVSLDQQRQSSSSLGARSDSMASVYSGAGEGRSCSIPVRGEVEFGLQYNYKAGDLEIYVKQCKDLAAVDAKRNRSDPYVKVYLLPDKSKSGKRKTKVKKHTLNPIFDEVLKFHISLNGLETRTLWLTVWHSDMFGRNDFLGEVMMSLENKVFDDPTPRSYTLQERTEPFEDVLSYKGEIIIGLKFVPPDASTLQKKGKRSKGSLNVKIKEAKNLTAVKGNGVSDPFCKSYLLPDKGRNSKQKTPVQRRTCNPSWNHTFVYEDVSLQELSERCLELTVWDHDRLASNEFLGGLRFSLGSGKHYGKAVDWMDSTGKEVSLWQSMLEKPNLWVEGCLLLRASLDPPNSVT